MAIVTQQTALSDGLEFILGQFDSIRTIIESVSPKGILVENFYQNISESLGCKPNFDSIIEIYNERTRSIETYIERILKDPEHIDDSQRDLLEQFAIYLNTGKQRVINALLLFPPTQKSISLKDDFQQDIDRLQVLGMAYQFLFSVLDRVINFEQKYGLELFNHHGLNPVNMLSISQLDSIISDFSTIAEQSRNYAQLLKKSRQMFEDAIHKINELEIAISENNYDSIIDMFSGVSDYLDEIRTFDVWNQNPFIAKLMKSSPDKISSEYKPVRDAVLSLQKLLIDHYERAKIARDRKFSNLSDKFKTIYQQISSYVNSCIEALVPEILQISTISELEDALSHYSKVNSSLSLLKGLSYDFGFKLSSHLREQEFMIKYNSLCAIHQNFKEQQDRIMKGSLDLLSRIEEAFGNVETANSDSTATYEEIREDVERINYSFIHLNDSSRFDPLIQHPQIEISLDLDFSTLERVANQINRLNKKFQKYEVTIKQKRPEVKSPIIAENDPWRMTRAELAGRLEWVYIKRKINDYCALGLLHGIGPEVLVTNGQKYVGQIVYVRLDTFDPEEGLSKILGDESAKPPRADFITTNMPRFFSSGLSRDMYILYGVWSSDQDNGLTIPTLHDINKLYDPGRMGVVGYFPDKSNPQQGYVITSKGSFPIHGFNIFYNKYSRDISYPIVFLLGSDEQIPGLVHFMGLKNRFSIPMEPMRVKLITLG